MGLTNVDLYRVDGTLGSVSNISTSALNGGPLSGTRNRIINGDMRIDQRNAGASVTPTNGQYTLDRWGAYAFGSATSKYTVQRNAGSVTPPAGFSNYLGVTSLSAYSVAAGDITGIYQAIEGFNVADFAYGTASAVTSTLSFWVRSSLTGTFSGVVRNAAANRSYAFTYTISVANTWELKTVQIPGDTTGTWITDNGAGLYIVFSLGTGTTYSGAAGSWSASNIYAATGSTSVVGTNGATFYITGVQLEAGTVATPFERRSFGQEFLLCQRYFEKSYNINVVPGTISTEGVAFGYTQSGALNSAFIAPVFNVKKRAKPTINVYNANTGVAGQMRDGGAIDTAVTVNSGFTGESSTLWANSGSVLTTNAACWAHYTASAEL